MTERSASQMHAAPLIAPRPISNVAVGISACLLGEAVRYDGGHTRDASCHEQLRVFFDFVPLCPEVAIGLGVPRAPIQLVGDARRPSARGVHDSSLDPTLALRDFADVSVIGELRHVSGYIFMQRSPSCGVNDVPVHDLLGKPVGLGSGVYAAQVMARLPLLPVADNVQLQDAQQRERFIEQVFTHAHWRTVMAEGITAARLIGFHSRYKFLLLAHSHAAYLAAGKLLANLRNDVDINGAEYFRLLMGALARVATRGGHVNALQHLQGFVDARVAAADQSALTASINAYARGECDLAAPRNALRALLQRFTNDYALAQVYLQPPLSCV